MCRFIENLYYTCGHNYYGKARVVANVTGCQCMVIKDKPISFYVRSICDVCEHQRESIMQKMRDEHGIFEARTPVMAGEGSKSR